MQDSPAERQRATDRNRDRLLLIAEVSRRLSESTDYRATLTTIGTMAMHHLDAWCIVDLVADPTDGEADDAMIRLAVLHPDPRKQQTARELHRRYPPQEHDLIGVARVLLLRRPEVVHELSDEALAASARDSEQLALLSTLGVTSYVVAPMLVRDRVLGAITFVIGDRARRFDDEDVLFVEDLARRAALATEYARLYEEALTARAATESALTEAAVLQAELERALDDANAARVRTATLTTRLQALSAALAMASTQQEVAEAVVAHAAAVLGAVGIVIARLAPGGEQLEIMSASAMPDNERRRWARFDVSAPVPLAEVARTGAPIFLKSRAVWMERYAHLLPTLEATGHHANAIVPLIVEGRVLGVLGAAFDAPRMFTEEERASALSVAQQCAQALERARLFEAERAARADAEQANRAKSEFLAAMSHELRTPLNAIGGYAQLLDMGLHGPVTDAQREALGRIELAQRYLLRHVNDLLNFERLRTGRLEYDVRPVALADVVVAVEPMILPQLRTKELSYVVHVPHEQMVQADRDKLTQVIINLLSNAVKFTPPGGKVTIECVARRDGGEDPDNIFLRVGDTGIGIPREKMDTVFEPFVQVDASPAGRASGAGLGLAISRDLARGMGGDLRVRSKVNEGTTFTVRLPRAHESHDASHG